MRRIFWGLVGIGLGAAVGLQAARWANRTKQRYSPPNLAREAGGKLADLKGRLQDALSVGAEEMAVREAELRAEIGLPPR